MIHGPLMLDLTGLTLTKEEEVLLENPYVGGVVLFTRNYEGPNQLASLVEAIRLIKNDLIITVDQEGGRVQRFRGSPFTTIPAMGFFGKLWCHDEGRALELARETGWVMATEILSFNIDLSFAPVLDLDHGLSRVIGDRAFSNSSLAVCALASAFRKGMNEAGMAAVGKHFPGHGGVALDSHIGLPKDKRTKEEVNRDIEPFRSLIADGLEGMMPAHIIYEHFDDKPAGFSSFWLKEKLRKELNFQGVVVSDCLGMAGAKFAGSFSERAEMALNAGCDAILVCNDRTGALEVLQWLDKQQYPLSKTLFKLKTGVNFYHGWEYLSASERRTIYHYQLQDYMANNKD